MIAVTCAIIELDQDVLCAKRGPNMSLPGKWEFPGGKVEQGESNEECLKREILEELGVTIKIENTLPEVFYSYPSGPELKLIPMLCSILNGKPKAVEHSEVRWVKKLHLLELDWAAADISVVHFIMRNKY